MKEKATNLNIMGMEKNEEFHKIDKDKASAEDMLSWLKSA